MCRKKWVVRGSLNKTFPKTTISDFYSSNKFPNFLNVQCKNSFSRKQIIRVSNFQVSINAWLWSIIFHFRDTSFSEQMDYIGATSLIYATLGVFGFR